jgi:hypothetical protein
MAMLNTVHAGRNPIVDHQSDCSNRNYDMSIMQTNRSVRFLYLLLLESAFIKQGWASSCSTLEHPSGIFLQVHQIVKMSSQYRITGQGVVAYIARYGVVVITSIG